MEVINATIEDEVRELQEDIAREKNRTKHNKFNDINLEFELRTYEARLRYLEDLAVDVEKGKGRTKPQDKVDEYFKDIYYDVDRENRTLDELNDLFDNYANNTILKLQISNMEKKL